MPLENRDLAVGTRLVATYKKEEHVCDVVQTENGVRYRLADGTEYRSPSSTGKAVMGGVACNGWSFWSLAGENGAKPKPAAKAKAPAKKPTTTKAAPKKGKATKKPKAQRAAASRDSYGCSACGETFASMKAATQDALSHTTQ